MFAAKVDLGDLAGAEERFERAYQVAVGQMKATLDAAAATERATHGYQNRTGDLEASTRASEVQSTSDGHQVDLEATMPYAGHVARRGLMHLDELAAEAETELAYLFDGLSLVI